MEALHKESEVKYVCHITARYGSNEQLRYH